MGYLLYLMFRCDRRYDGCDGKFGNFVRTKTHPWSKTGARLDTGAKTALAVVEDATA